MLLSVIRCHHITLDKNSIENSQIKPHSYWTLLIRPGIIMNGSCEHCSYLMETPSNRIAIGVITCQAKQCSRCHLLQDIITPHLSSEYLQDTETTVSLYLPGDMPMDISIYTRDNPYIPRIVLHLFKCNSMTIIGRFLPITNL
jgi:hypothetical protein